MCLSSRTIFLALALVLTAFAEARADRIELRTGEVLVGKILRNNEEEVSIQLKTGGVLSFKWSIIQKIRKGTETYEKPKDLPPPPVAPPERAAARKKNGPPPERTAAPKPSPTTQGAAPREQEPPMAKPSLQRAPAPAPPEPIENSITDDERGFSITPPKGLVPRPEARSEVVPVAFVDPFTRASFTVSAYPSSDTVLQVKKSTLRSLTDNFSVFRVLRDEKLRRDGKDVEPETWVVEIESKVGTTSIRQLQVFTKTERCVVILSYSATMDTFPRHEEAFTQSVLSFRAMAVSEKPVPAADPQG
jgi:hypothetical protein